jgi:N utilization substance protein B
MLIRIKVLQVLYAYYQNGSNNLKAAENEILFSLQKAYDLYHYILLLMGDVTFLQRRIIDNRKHKYQPTEEDLNPNMRFVNNRFIKQLSENKQLEKYVSENKISWDNDQDFIKNTLDGILATDIYARYMAQEEDSYEADREFWKEIVKDHFSMNENLADHLEDKSLYWNDDVEIVLTFTYKTIRKFDSREGALQALLPMYNDVEDRYFAIQLLRKAIINANEYREIIDRNVRNWENERIASIDIYIMQLAVTELLYFPNIPINVTFNEYIDAAKYYSTPKSGIFINGVLDAMVNELKRENRLIKI